MPSPGCPGLYNGQIEVSRRIVSARLEPQVPPSGDRKSEAGECDAAGIGFLAEGGSGLAGDYRGIWAAPS